jgi:cytochrome b involved in lipid metabolism
LISNREDDKEFTLDEIAKGKSYSVCLVSLFGHVYNLAKFLPLHPGGEKVLIEASGDIIDDVFDDGNHRHLKEKIPEMLKHYKVGVLKK